MAVKKLTWSILFFLLMRRNEQSQLLLISPTSWGRGFHDLRHDFATKLLRGSGDLDIVQRAFPFTTKDAQMLGGEIAATIKAASARRKRKNNV